MRLPALPKRLPFRPEKPPRPAPLAYRECRRCGAGLAPGQEWCLECGSAPSRGFGLPTDPQSYIGVVAVTLLVGLAAGAGAYAALSGGSKHPARRAAAVSVPPPATPDVATTTTPAPSVAPPSTVRPPAVIRTPTPVVAPRVTPTPAPTRPATTTPATTTPATPTTTTAPSAAVAIPLTGALASTYNPYGSPAASFGDPAKAIDGDPATAWTYRVAPTGVGRARIGLAIKLKSPETIGAVKLSGTPGMRIELYGATGTEPPAITDRLWHHLASIDATTATTTTRSSALAQPFDYLLIWIPTVSPGTTAGTVRISEVSLSTPSS